MTSNEYVQERSVSWRSVAAGFTLAALAMTGLFTLELATHFASSTDGPTSAVSLPVAEGKRLVRLQDHAQTLPSADDFVPADSLPDEDEHLFDCPHCE